MRGNAKSSTAPFCGLCGHQVFAVGRCRTCGCNGDSHYVSLISPSFPATGSHPPFRVSGGMPVPVVSDPSAQGSGALPAGTGKSSYDWTLNWSWLFAIGLVLGLVTLWSGSANGLVWWEWLLGFSAMAIFLVAGVLDGAITRELRRLPPSVTRADLIREVITPDRGDYT